MAANLEELKARAINPKIRFKFLAMSNPDRDPLEGMHGKWQAYMGKKDPETCDEFDLLRWKRAYESMLGAESLEEGIGNVAHELAAEIGNVAPLLMTASSMERRPIPEFAASLFIAALNDPPVKGESPMRIAALLFNAAMERNGHLPLVFYHPSLKALSELAMEGIEPADFLELLKGLASTSLRYNRIHDDMSPAEIIARLKNMEKELKAKFQLRHLWLFGSYANGLFTPYSDIDVLIDAQGNNDSRVEKFLEKTFDIPIDVVNVKEPFAKSRDLTRFKRKVF